jgi:hypothetical protein
LSSKHYGFDISNEYLCLQDLSMGMNIFDLVTLTLVFDLYIENFNPGYIFWLVGATALIFHMNVPCDKTFSWVQKKLTLRPWPWCLTYLLKTNFNFRMVRARALIFHMSISCDKVFLWVLNVLTLLPWPWYLIYLSKTWTMAISFELYVLGLWHFTWLFLVSRPFRGYQKHLTLWPWPWCLICIWKTLTLAMIFEGLPRVVYEFYTLAFWHLYKWPHTQNTARKTHTLHKPSDHCTENSHMGVNLTVTLNGHMSFCYDKSFQCVRAGLTSWPWHLCFTYLTYLWKSFNTGMAVNGICFSRGHLCFTYTCCFSFFFLINWFFMVKVCAIINN